MHTPYVRTKYMWSIFHIWFLYVIYMYIWYMCAHIYEEGSYQPSLLAEKSKITSTLKNEVSNHGSMQRWQVSLMLPHIKGLEFKPQAVWCWPSGCILSTEKIFRAHVGNHSGKMGLRGLAGSYCRQHVHLAWKGKHQSRTSKGLHWWCFVSSAALMGNRKPIQSFVK